MKKPSLMSSPFNKHNQRIEHLGLSLAESTELLSTLQRHLLQQQIDTFSSSREVRGGMGYQ